MYARNVVSVEYLLNHGADVKTVDRVKLLYNTNVYVIFISYVYIYIQMLCIHSLVAQL